MISLQLGENQKLSSEATGCFAHCPVFPSQAISGALAGLYS